MKPIFKRTNTIVSSNLGVWPKYCMYMYLWIQKFNNNTFFNHKFYYHNFRYYSGMYNVNVVLNFNLSACTSKMYCRSSTFCTFVHSAIKQWCQTRVFDREQPFHSFYPSACMHASACQSIYKSGNIKFWRCTIFTVFTDLPENQEVCLTCDFVKIVSTKYTCRHFENWHYMEYGNGSSWQKSTTMLILE